MQKAGYIASLETTTEWLNKCEYGITYFISGDREQTDYIKAVDLDYYLNYYPENGYEILAVSKIEKEKIAELAKAITDKFAKRVYNYVHQEA